VFLANVGPTALKSVKQAKRDTSKKGGNGAKRAAKAAAASRREPADERRDASYTPFVAAFGGFGHSSPSTRRMA
jgi:hypothetical protein